MSLIECEWRPTAMNTWAQNAAASATRPTPATGLADKSNLKV